MEIMTTNPKTKALLRVHRRLATKLTTDEVRAIRDYIEERISQEQSDLKFRYFSLQNDFDITVRRSSETITELYNELAEKKEIIRRYQSSDEKIITVYKQKEARWDKKQELLLEEIQKLDRENREVKSKLKQAEESMAEQKAKMEAVEEALVVANEAVAKVEEAKVVFSENKGMKEEMLKLKMEMDRKERQFQHTEAELRATKAEVTNNNKEKKVNEHKVTSMQQELQKQVKEVTEKCRQLSELQFQLQLEKRQAESLQTELKKATANLDNYRQILDDGRKPLSESDQIVLTLRKDMDIMDIRIRALDISVRLKLDEMTKVEDRIEDLNTEEKLASQIKNELYIQGDTFLEMTSAELLKVFNFRRKRLQEEFKYAKDWEYPKREADILRAEITGLMKQASICKISDLGSRAAKQLQKIDLIMRVSGETKMPKIFKVSERSNSDKKQPPSKKTKAFLSASTPIDGLDSNYRVPSLVPKRRFSLPAKVRQPRRAFDNHTDDSKLNSYLESTVELDLSRLTPVSSPRHGHQSDRLTLRSVSTNRQGVSE